MQCRQKAHDKLHSTAGFTLTELLVVICLLGLLSGFFLQCFVFVMEQYRNRIALLELEDNLCMAMDFLAADFEKTVAVSGCNGSSLTLQTNDGKIYYTVGTDTQAKEHFYDLEGKIFYRRENTQKNRQPMANFISNFSVVYYDETGTPTETDSTVETVEILLEGTWNDTVIQQRQFARLKDSDYL